MAGSLNQVTLIGNLGRDPEITSTRGGTKVAKFSIATSESWRDKQTGERKEATQWHNVVVWNEGLVTVIEKYLRKGSKIYVEGRMETRNWEKDNVKHYTTEVVLRNFGGTILMLDRKADDSRGPSDDPGEERHNPGGTKPATTSYADDLDDEIPF